MHQMTVIPLSALRRDARLWPRRQLCKALVEELAEIFRHNGTVGIEPIVVVRIGRHGCYFLIDGWHRVAAAELAGITHLPVRIVDLNSEQEAYELAVRLSSRGKTPMTRAEKQTAVDRLLAAHPDWSDLAVAQLAGVSNHLVAARRRLLAEPPIEREQGERRPRPDKYARSIMKAAREICARFGAEEDARLEDALASAAVRECGRDAARCLRRLRGLTEGAESRALPVAREPRPAAEAEGKEVEDEELALPVADPGGGIAGAEPEAGRVSPALVVHWRSPMDREESRA